MIRKDSFLSVALDTNFEGWDCKELSQKSEMQEQVMEHSNESYGTGGTSKM